MAAHAEQAELSKESLCVQARQRHNDTCMPRIESTAQCPTYTYKHGSSPHVSSGSRSAARHSSPTTGRGHLKPTRKLPLALHLPQLSGSAGAGRGAGINSSARPRLRARAAVYGPVKRPRSARAAPADGVRPTPRARHATTVCIVRITAYTLLSNRTCPDSDPCSAAGCTWPTRRLRPQGADARR